MGLFASDETVRLYIKDGEIVEEETDTWVAVIKELPIALAQEISKLRNASVVMRENGAMEVKLDSLELLPPAEILAKIIKAWSEPVPITPQNIAKMEHKLLKNLWLKLTEMYGLGGGGGAVGV